MRGLATTLVVALVGVPCSVSAQDPPPRPQQRQQQQQPQDTVPAIPAPPFRFKPPIPPLGALGMSMLLPGLGQAVLGRRVTGAVFVFWEGITLTMYLKSRHQLEYQEDIGADTVEDKKEEVQDWFVLLVFNHLLAGLEAFVSAQLWDFPTELEARVLPGGSVGVGLSIPVRLGPG